jgi:hypothetical protein
MDIFNNTIIPAQNYGTETYLHEMLLQSPHRCVGSMCMVHSAGHNTPSLVGS